MNVAQELGDDKLYNYDILVKLLGDRFDLASRVSASRSRFHGWLRHHQEDADSFADTITDLCRVGYPQSSPELRQELISKQFMRGQLDPELKKYLWVVVRTQKDRKLQTSRCAQISAASVLPQTFVGQWSRSLQLRTCRDHRSRSLLSKMSRYGRSTPVDRSGHVRLCCVTVFAADVCSGPEDGQ